MSMGKGIVRNALSVLEAYRGPRRTGKAARPGGLGSFEGGLQALRDRWPEIDGAATAVPVFILAAGWRSGSTLLQRMVLANGQTLVWGEPYAHSNLAGSLMRQVHAFTADWPEDKWMGRAALAGNGWTANLYPSIADFADAHRVFWLRMFERPATREGWRNWGIKETRWGLAEARYLKWLFPKARLVFLYRNPYDAYASYRHWRDWYYRWPDQPIVTPRQFGKIWRSSVEDFLDGCQALDALLVAYESLFDREIHDQLCTHLGEMLVPPGSLSLLRGYEGPSSGRPSPLELARLETTVEPVASRLGYGPPSIWGPARARSRRSRRSASSSPQSDALA